MNQTFVIASGVRDRILERFFDARYAHDYAQQHPASMRILFRTLNVKSTLWTVRMAGLPAFCFQTEEAAEHFIDRNVAADTACLISQARTCPPAGDDLLYAREALRDLYGIERLLVLYDGSAVREWDISHDEACTES